MKFPSVEFDNAVASLCDGSINDETLAELHVTLKADTSAQDEYLWRVEVHGELAAGRLDYMSASGNPAGERGTETHIGIAVAHNAVTRDSVSLTDTSSYLSRRRMQSLAIVATLLVIAATGAWWVSRHNRTTVAAPEQVARFVGLDESDWMVSSNQVQIGDAILVGQRIELSSGSAELEFNSGARLKLVGPAIVEPLTNNSAFLMMGEVHVVAQTPTSKGFRLNTRTSTFVDISTAFSATVAPDGLSRLDVTEGEVDVVLEGAGASPRLRSGESLYVEPGQRQVMTRIEQGSGTAAFQFPTIEPPRSNDLADQAVGRADIQVIRGKLNFKPGGGTSGPASVLLDGAGQSKQNAPMESAFFDDNTSGSLLVDLGQVVSVHKVNSYSWHQHDKQEQHRHRAQQRFTLYGFAGNELPDLDLPPASTGWTRIARVNSDRFFRVGHPLDRPAQQASSVTAAQGEIGQFRYLLWEVNHHTFFGELDVFGSPSNDSQDSGK